MPVVRAGSIALFIVAVSGHDSVMLSSQSDDQPWLSVKPLDDFEVNGAGRDAAWQPADWTQPPGNGPIGHNDAAPDDRWALVCLRG